MLKTVLHESLVGLFLETVLLCSLQFQLALPQSFEQLVPVGLNFPNERMQVRNDDILAIGVYIFFLESLNHDAELVLFLC